jgi:DNA-binding HxlR family transcriptional regulator
MPWKTSTGQFCTVARCAEALCERWTPLVVRELLCGSRRFNDLHRGVPRMSTSLLTQRLRRLEEFGIVRREAPARSGSTASRKPARSFGRS